MGVLSLLWTRDSVYRELHFADLEVRFLPDDARNLPDLSRLEGVRKIERRLVFPGIIRPPGKTPITAVMTSLEAPSPGIHSFKFLQGRPFRADELDAVVIDTSLAAYHGYRVGDTIDIKVGEALYHRRVVGIAITPEYFVSTSNPTYFIPERGSLGFIFANLRRHVRRSRVHSRQRSRLSLRRRRRRLPRQAVGRSRASASSTSSRSARGSVTSAISTFRCSWRASGSSFPRW